MRRAIIKEYDKLAENLSNYIGVMKYRLMNLCVKAEPVSLLPIKVVIEGEQQNLEDCVNMAKDGEYKFVLFPKYEEDMKDIIMGITMAHPEFKQEIKKMNIPVPDADGNTVSRETSYLQLTMPEVDDERYEVLKNSAKLIYDECKAQMEFSNNKSNVKFAELASTETEENMDILKKELEKLNAQWNEQRDKLYDEKLKEISKAYNKWLGSMAQSEIAKMEDEDAHSDHTGMSMRLGHHEEN